MTCSTSKLKCPPMALLYLRKTLHYENLSYVNIHKSWKEVLEVLSGSYYKSEHDYMSEVGLFVQKGAGIKSNYDRAVEEFYKSKVIDVDFGASGSGEIKSAVNR